MTDKTQELLDRLHAGVQSLVTGDDWKRALEVQARFHKYSFGNTLLIAVQRPNATYVGGLKSLWNKVGRHVRKGEKGIAILAPLTVTRTDPDTGEKRQAFTGRYRTVYVFDVSQTEGEPFALGVMQPEELDGDAPVALYETLTREVESRGYTVRDGSGGTFEFENGAKGFTDPRKKEVAVKHNASALQRTKTLVHELAHIMLHVSGDPTSALAEYVEHRGIAETEAESIAFIVCGALGLPTDDYSFSYVGGWSGGDMDLVKKTGERVAKTARSILAAFEKEKEVAA